MSRAVAVFVMILTIYLVNVTARAEEYLELSGGPKIYTNDQGSGSPPVIFIHGWCMSSELWKDQVPFFKNFYRTIYYDLRGHGNSEKVDWGHTLGQYARDLRELMIKKELNEVVLVGWSMGASVIWEYIRQFGEDRLKGIVIVDMVPYFFATEDYPYGYAGEWKYEDREKITREVGLGYQEHGSLWGMDFIREMFKEEPAGRIVEWIFHEFEKTPKTVASLLIFDIFTNDYRELLNKINLPALICVGSDGKVFPPGVGGYLQERIPGSKLIVFEKSGHVPFLEETEKFNQALKSFIGELK